MIVDSSAIIAILQQEPEAERIARAMTQAPRLLMAAPTLLECSIKMYASYREAGLVDLDMLIQKYGLRIVSMTSHHTRFARDAFIRYGKGIHPARLNFGDCIAYALARVSGEPLLFKGTDFHLTDIPAAAY